MSERPFRSRLYIRLFFSMATLQSLIWQRRPAELVSKAYRLWKRAGIAGVWRRGRWLWHATFGYASWVRQFDALDGTDRRAIRAQIDQLCRRPRISVLMPTYNSPERWLRQAVESVRNQLYPDWELCIADDASSQPHVRAILEEYQRLDGRIRIVFREHNGHISAASNSALALASGEFVALLDHDDELSEHALYMVALALEDSPELNLIYSDEDKIDEHGRRFGPYFKPDWNPDLLDAQNMISHLGVYRTDLLRSIGGFREGVEGAQDWDVALRVGEQIPPSTIRHIPHVLYHWRAISGSTAIGHEEKTYVASASQRVVLEHLQRINQLASVESAFSSFVRIRYPLPMPAPLVSIILFGNSADSEELVRRTNYKELEIIPCPSCDDGTLTETINRTAHQTRGELLCFLDAGLMPETEHWLEELIVQAWRPEIGAVGPMQLDADGNVVYGLTVLCDMLGKNEISWGFYRGMHHEEKGVAGRAALQQNVTVLATGCLILRTEIFWKVNGFDANKFPASLLKPDLCLRLVQAGYRNLWVPYTHMISSLPSKHASTYAVEACFEGNNEKEVEQFRLLWRPFLDHDPAHNPNLVCGDEWPFPAFPPRIDYPWR